jgi:hypothetical protein
MEQYNDGLLTPGPSTPEGRDRQNQNNSPSSDLEQHALDEQLARKQPSDVSRRSRDLSAIQIENYINFRVWRSVFGEGLSVLGVFQLVRNNPTNSPSCILIPQQSPLQLCSHPMSSNYTSSYIMRNLLSKHVH